MGSSKSTGSQSGRTMSNTSAQLLRDIRQWAHEKRFALWVTLGFIIINIGWWSIYAVQHKSLPYGEFTTTLADFNPLTILPSLILTRSISQLIVEAILMLIILCFAEPLLGARRTIWVSLLSAVIGTGIGVVLCEVLTSILNTRRVVSHLPFSLNPVILVLGALLASSAFAYQLLRRRIRLIGYTAILVVLLYGGSPGDYCTLATAIVGQIIGRILAGSPVEGEQWHWQYSSEHETRRIMGAIGAILALGPVVAATSRTHAGPLASLAWIMSPASSNTDAVADCLHDATSAQCIAQFSLIRSSMSGEVLRSILPLLVMLALAWGVYLGRRTAAICSMIFYFATAAITVTYYLVIPLATDGIEHAVAMHAIESCVINTIVPLAYAIALVVTRRSFSIRTKEHVLRVGGSIAIATFVICSAIYVVYCTVFPQDFTPRPTIGQVFADLPSRFLPVGFLRLTRLEFVPTTPMAHVVYQGVGLIFWIVLVIVAFAWLNASIRYDNDAREGAEELVEHGGESMSFMTTWEGNEYWLSSTGRSAVAYRVLNHIALTTTGPFGDPEEWMSDLDEFAKYCRNHSWSPVFYAIHQEARDHLARLGWHSIMVGEEMLIDPQSWKTTGKKWQDIRTAINKAKREGITDEFTTYEQAPHDVQIQIEQISENWSEGKALPEMKFTLGGVEELKDPRVKILYAIDSDGVVQGVTSWLPTWRDGRVIGYTLDFMRYKSGSYNGIMEFLIARMANRMHDWGVEHPDEQIEYVSLSAAPLSGLEHASDATSDDHSNIDGTTLLQHSLAYVADLLEPAYGFRSLYNFKKKFQPIERPVYISYPDSALLANLGIAIIRAYLPELTFREALGMLKTFKPEPKPKKSKQSEASAAAAATPKAEAAQSSSPTPVKSADSSSKSAVDSAKSAGTPSQSTNDAKSTEESAKSTTASSTESTKTTK